MKRMLIFLICIAAFLNSEAQHRNKSLLKIKARYPDCPNDSIYLRVTQDVFYTTDDISQNRPAFKGIKDKGYTEWTIDIDSTKEGYFLFYIKYPDTSRLGIMSNYSENRLSPPFIFSPGDSLLVTISNPTKSKNAALDFNTFNYSFLGPGSQKDSLLAKLLKDEKNLLFSSYTREINSKSLDFKTEMFVNYFKRINTLMRLYMENYTVGIYKSLYTYLYWQAVTDFVKSIQVQYLYSNRSSLIENQTAYENLIEAAESLFDFHFLDSEQSNFFMYSYDRHTLNLTQLDDTLRHIPIAKQFLNIITDSTKVKREDLVIRFFQKNDTRIANFDSFYNAAKPLILSKEKFIEFTKYENRKNSLTFFNWALEENKTEKPFVISSLKNKIVFIDFWFAGCHGCTDYYTKHLKFTEEYFQNNSDVVFVSINVDRFKEKWKVNISTNKYTNQKALNLYTNGLGFFHPMLDYLRIPSYPTLMLFNKNGSLVMFNKQMTSAQLIQKIQSLM